MKTIKLLLAALTLILSLDASQSIYAQSDNPCNPDSTACTECACRVLLPEGCTEESRLMVVYTDNPDCLATVYYRLRFCENDCYPNKCQLIIDSVTVDQVEYDCVNCAVVTAADMKEFLAQIERQLLMHGAYNTLCNHILTGNQTFNYYVAKPACWKRKAGSGGGILVDGVWVYQYEPCNHDQCCVSNYCVYVDQYGSYYIAKVGPSVCPGPEPLDCQDGCTGGMFICEDPDE
jgi:hypothetical protein